MGLGLFAKGAIQTAGRAQALELRLKLLTEQYGEYDEALKIAEKAQRTFGMSALEATDGITNIIGRLRPLGVSLKDIETTYFGFNTAATMAGVSAVEASGAFRQLAQALGSGRLQGDEFRSLAEQVPTLLKPIADELGTTVGGLKKLSSEGKITSEVIIRALAKIGEEGGGNVEKIVSQSSLQRFKEFRNAMEDLSRAVGEQLMPAITPFVVAATKLVQIFAGLNPAIQGMIVGITAVSAGVLVVAPAIVTLVQGLIALKAALKVGVIVKALGLIAATAAGKLIILVGAVGLLAKGIQMLIQKMQGAKKAQEDFKQGIENGNISLMDAEWRVKELNAQLEKLERKKGDSSLSIYSGAIERDINKTKKQIEELEETINNTRFEAPLVQSMQTFEVEGVGVFDGLTRAYIGMTEKMKAAQKAAADKNLAEFKREEEAQKKKQKATEEWKQTLEQIKDTLAQGMTDAVMGLIEGTRTLGESLAGIAKSLARMFINKAFTSMFANMFPTQEGGIHKGGFKAFANGGVATGPTLGLIGEGGEDEYVIPSSKMEGAMQRYSAGARGQGVVPGGGTVASGSGVGSGGTTVNYTGPILNFNGDDYVPRSAVGDIINTAAKRGAAAGSSQTMRSLKNSRSQRAGIGI